MISDILFAVCLCTIFSLFCWKTWKQKKAGSIIDKKFNCPVLLEEKHIYKLNNLDCVSQEYEQVAYKFHTTMTNKNPKILAVMIIFWLFLTFHLNFNI